MTVLYRAEGRDSRAGIAKYKLSFKTAPRRRTNAPKGGGGSRLPERATGLTAHNAEHVATRLVAFRRSAHRLGLGACEASALPLSYAPAEATIPPAPEPAGSVRSGTKGTKETAARARVAPPSVAEPRSSDGRSVAPATAPAQPRNGRRRRSTGPPASG
jgi:hypothetical protein